MGNPRVLQPRGLQRVGYNLATEHHHNTEPTKKVIADSRSKTLAHGHQWANAITVCTLLIGPAMAPHSSTLAWKIPWTEEPGGLQSMGLLTVGHDWVTSLSLFTFMHWRRKWQPTLVFLPENPRDGGAWWAAIYGVAQSRTRLKWLSSNRASRHFFLPLPWQEKMNHAPRALA